MYERLLTETERFLARRKTPATGIKALWQSVHREGVRQGFAVPSLVDFSCLLDGDKRFEVMMNGGEAEKARDVDLMDYEEMEKLGFQGGQYVRLRPAARRVDDDEDDAGDTAGDEDDLLLDRALLAETHAIVKVKKTNAAAKKKSPAPVKKKRIMTAPKKKKVLKHTTVRRKK